jgi:phosphoribosylformimino-5-aminoimidazole carboxamide ribotide isomerase
MKILPAIDLLGGKAVRLHQGRYDQVTVFSDDPPAVAKKFREHTDLVHVVDLEGAKEGRPVQEDVIRKIGGPIQVGGGVRTKEAFDAYLALGAKRVVLGTAAVRNRDLVRGLAVAHPGVVVLAVDAKDGFVATDGWTNVSTVRAVDVVGMYGDVPIGAVLYTDIARDGTGIGPNVRATAELAAASPFPVIASGGVGTKAHLEALALIENVESAIVGRALYDGSLTLADAISSATPSRSPT